MGSLTSYLTKIHPPRSLPGPKMAIKRGAREEKVRKAWENVYTCLWHESQSSGFYLRRAREIRFKERYESLDAYNKRSRMHMRVCISQSKLAHLSSPWCDKSLRPDCDNFTNHAGIYTQGDRNSKLVNDAMAKLFKQTLRDICSSRNLEKKISSPPHPWMMCSNFSAFSYSLMIMSNNSWNKNSSRAYNYAGKTLTMRAFPPYGLLCRYFN
jgi:hypothetical protein